ncbi:Transcriptional repressor SmtB [Candidatus Brocadiaceae bacterium]|nr:Transcriptional repressor SmtB [Candidatus Brocadiaceae bacterium]
MNSDICEIQSINPVAVEEVKKTLPGIDLLIRVAGYFKFLSDPTRLNIVASLMTSELCVCDIAHITGVSVSAVSHQLRYLKAGGILKSKKDGKMVYYSLKDEHFRLLILQALEHADEKE